MRRLTAFCLLLGLLAGRAVAADFRSGESVDVTAAVAETLFTAGQTVQIQAPVGGNLFSAGFDLAVRSAVGGDAMIAGYEVDVTGPVGGDLLAVGMTVQLAGPVAGDARATAPTVKLEPSSRIGGDLAVSGGEITLAGTVAGDVQVAAERVVVSGNVNGTLDVAAAELVLEPGARIQGDIRHAGPTPVEVPQGATVQGTIQYRKDDIAEGSDPSFWGTLGQAVALFLLGYAVYWAAPGILRAGMAEVGSNWAKSLTIGLLALVLVPIAAIVMVLTLIGIPVGLLLLGLYMLALPLGLAVAGFSLAELAARHRDPGGRRSGTILARYAVFCLLLPLAGMIPFLGGVVLPFAIALGLGALLLRALDSRRRARFAM